MLLGHNNFFSKIASKKNEETFNDKQNIYSAFGSIDVVTGNKAVTIDTKLIIPLHNGFGIFNRNTIHEPYNEDGEFFHVSQIHKNYLVPENCGGNSAGTDKT